MFDLPQTILNRLLTIKNLTPERLSNDEMQIAARVCHCTLCDSFWVRRLKVSPPRCPNCHKRGWDRPLLTAMMQGYPPTNTTLIGSAPTPALTEGEK